MLLTGLVRKVSKILEESWKLRPKEIGPPQAGKGDSVEAFLRGFSLTERLGGI